MSALPWTSNRTHDLRFEALFSKNGCSLFLATSHVRFETLRQEMSGLSTCKRMLKPDQFVMNRAALVLKPDSDLVIPRDARMSQDAGHVPISPAARSEPPYRTLHGACVFHKTLVKVDTSSTECRALLQKIIPLQHEAPAEHKSQCDFVAKESSLHGWVVGPTDQNGSWCVFIFCFLRNVWLPSEFLSVHSILCGALALGDLLLAFRCHHQQCLLEPPGQGERRSLQIVCIHSRLLQLQHDTVNPQSFTQASAHVRRYCDTLDLAQVDVWCAHVFLPDDTMLPSFLLHLPSPA